MCVVHSFFIRLMQELTSCYPSPHVFHYQQSERYSFVSWTNMVRAAAPTIQLPSYHLRLGPRYYCLQDLLTFIKLTHWQSWTVCRWKMIPVCRVVICDQPHSSYSVLDRLQALAEAPNRLSIQPRHLVRSVLDPAFPYLPLVLRSSSHFFCSYVMSYKRRIWLPWFPYNYYIGSASTSTHTFYQLRYRLVFSIVVEDSLPRLVHQVQYANFHGFIRNFTIHKPTQVRNER